MRCIDRLILFARLRMRCSHVIVSYSYSIKSMRRHTRNFCIRRNETHLEGDGDSFYREERSFDTHVRIMVGN